MNTLQRFFIFSWVFLFIVSLKSIVEGSIPFWYDSARDFLLALDNIKKPVLIGPPTGIPGVFYGPYWIWLISLGLLFTYDPRFIAFILQLLPYFTLFPFILFRFKNLFGSTICFLLYLLFILSYQIYTVNLWNPHIAPLMVLLLIYTIISAPPGDDRKSIFRRYVFVFVSAVASGMLLNFHLSFGIGITVAATVFITAETTFIIFRNKKRSHFPTLSGHLLTLPVFFAGVLITIVPFLVFEFRHDFLQTQALIRTLTNAFLYNSAVVGQTGLKEFDILHSFFVGKLTSLFWIRPKDAYGFYLLTIGFSIYRLRRGKLSITSAEKRLLAFIGLTIFFVLFIFISSKNPVWEYHFIGAEILALLVIGLMMKKYKTLETYVTFLTVVSVLSYGISFFLSFWSNQRVISSLATKEFIVDTIYTDGKNHAFSVVAYSPSIYTYDFDYLIQWKGKKQYNYLPEADITKSEYVYLIIPKSPDAVAADFINYKTPNTGYQTLAEWNIADGSIILKRAAVKQ